VKTSHGRTFRLSCFGLFVAGAILAAYLYGITRFPSPRWLFLGDSLILSWDTSKYNAINAGVGGETSASVLWRFRFIPLGPDTLVLEAGANDIAAGISLEQWSSNIREMSWMAQRRNMRVIICTLTPTERRLENLVPLSEVQRRNAWLAEYAARTPPVTLVDMYAVLAGPDGYVRDGLTFDGQHPNERGYALMEAALIAATGERLVR
jgi:lysophospholipase L1-like esterase